MFKRNLFLILLVFFASQNSNIFFNKTKDSNQIISQVCDYNLYTEKQLVQLKSIFCFLEDIKRRENIVKLLIQIRFKELEYSNKYQFINPRFPLFCLSSNCKIIVSNT